MRGSGPARQDALLTAAVALLAVVGLAIAGAAWCWRLLASRLGRLAAGRRRAGP